MRSALPDDQSKSHEARPSPGAVVNGFFVSGIKVEVGLAPATLRKEGLLEQRCFMRPL